MGSAIASIHTLRVMRSDLTGAGWVMIWLTFAWVAVTATGPFLYLARRFARRLADYPKIGDRLWAMLGIPWLLTAVIQSATAGSRAATELLVHDDVECRARPGLPDHAGRSSGAPGSWSRPSRRPGSRRSPWTNRVGLILAIAWPIQCGLGLVVLS